ncbi:hypothetical protein RHSIM_Rhsim10G0152900 [Rhododendron simsii]|uniref:Uncharacterized protein n=1 Tax=Rhododendron simsii TaxID=118357 RepID=A0A834GFP4_RHOSS|nr:hypothetical protein RHSIM_Rhsim10G0152900 [Rhododendron simsii]
MRTLGIDDNYTAPQMVLAASGVEHEELLKIHFFRTWPLYLVLRSQSLSMLEKTHFALAFEAPAGCLKEKEAANQAIVLIVLQGWACDRVTSVLADDSVVFGKATLGNCQTINGILNKLETGGSKYLGLPSIIRKSKRAVFSYATDCVDTKLKGWSEARLNNAGREVLLKSVVMTMPNYVMQCFLLPKGLLSSIV